MMIDAVEFIKNVNIERGDKDDDCEYEVTKQAMELYLKYPCYKNWKPFLYGSTLSNFIRYARLNKHECRGDKGYVGAYLLKNEEGDKALTADIITSIKSPINQILPEGAKLSSSIINEKIRENILKEKESISFEDLSQKPESIIEGEIVPYIIAFAKVYYWCGNMMPIIANWNGKGDAWYNKIDHMINNDCENENEYDNYMESGKKHPPIKLYKSWITKYYKNDIETFVNENFLTDFCKKQSEKIVVRSFTKLSEFKQDPDNVKKWFLNNTKLIIQRSYRIFYNFSGDWNDPVENEHNENLQEIMRYVFEEAGFSKEEVESETFLEPF